jgi:hypothetical protein
MQSTVECEYGYGKLTTNIGVDEQVCVLNEGASDGLKQTSKQLGITNNKQTTI